MAHDVPRVLVGSDATTAQLTARQDWFDALADVFGLRFPAVPAAALDRLWTQTLAGHRAWEAAGRP